MVKNIEVGNQSSLKKDNLDTLFCQVSNRCFEFRYLMDTLRQELKELPFLTRLRLKKDFKNKIGLSMDEFEILLSEIDTLWSKIKRSINEGDFTRLEQYLNSYNNIRLRIHNYLTAFPKYRQQIRTYEYKVPRSLTEETMGKIIWVSKDLNLSLRQIYSIIKL